MDNKLSILNTESNMSMNIENEEIALLVHSCDRYELLYKGFEFFFSKNWDPKIKCKLYFATEVKKVLVNGFTNIQSGKGEWADRLTTLLKEKISAKYILYVQEDMWINKKINGDFFDKLFEFTKKNNLQQVKLHSSDVYKTTATDSFIEGFNIAILDNVKSDFLMSHQITLWNKKFLLKQLYKKEHPWRNERKGTKRLKKINPLIYHIDYFAENGQPEINNNNNPILRSEYKTISANGALHSTVEPYIKELLNENSSLHEYALKLEHNYKNNLTHDGNPKPKKVDIFKRAKNWILGK
jgi:hypothetical protein